MNMAAKASKTDPAFKAQLAEVFDSYIKMKNAFVESNAAKVSKEATGVENALQDVKMELLKGDAHMVWMDQLKTLNSELKSIVGSSDIAAQRLAFAKFNDAFYKSVKSFGLDNDIAYYQYCPMANREKGAYWLSETKEIRNPYFGEDMLGCGETRETLN
jgi:Cu(I)/Ag(I) efflux system membrane fusion protein